MESPSPITSRRSWPRRLLNRMEVDKAVFFSVLLRVWQLVAGLATALLMTIFFSPKVQGYYYTFASLVALQTFFELGFNLVVVNVCSHEWVKLRLTKGVIVGDERARSRLISIGRLLWSWYAVAAVLFVLIVGFVGSAFIGEKRDPSIAWQQPWFALVLISGGLLAAVPWHAVLEGCNQVVPISIYRLVQAVVTSIAVWWTMAEGGELWTAVAASAARLLCDVAFLGGWYGRFFRNFLQRSAGESVAWRTEIWPLQWRIGILGVFAYFAFFLFTPVMFHYHGEEVAGQMGLTWTVVTAIQAAALAWVLTRGPRFGMLISAGEFDELDRIFFRLTAFAVAAYVGAASAFWLLLVGMNHFNVRLAERLLPELPTALFLAGALAQLVAACQAIYLRAHKREPFLITGAVTCVLLGLGIWLCGRRFGPTGAAAVFLAVNALVTLPAHSWIMRLARREWRVEPDVARGA